MRSQWKRVRYRLEWLGLRLAMKLVPLLPRKACFRLAYFLGALMSIFDRDRYKVALNNLEVAFGSQLSNRERRTITRESFQHFARTMVDLLWSPRLTPDNFSRYVELQNLEETTIDTGPERSIMIACYHYSNFEWLSLASRGRRDWSGFTRYYGEKAAPPCWSILPCLRARLPWRSIALD